MFNFNCLTTTDRFWAIAECFRRCIGIKNDIQQGNSKGYFAIYKDTESGLKTCLRHYDTRPITVRQCEEMCNGNVCIKKCDGKFGIKIGNACIKIGNAYIKICEACFGIDNACIKVGVYITLGTSRVERSQCKEIVNALG